MITNAIFTFKTIVLLVLCDVYIVSAQEIDCYGPGSIAGAVFGTFFATLAVLAAIYFVYKFFIKAKREKHLVLETDPEKGDKYAFDNPCFKDASGVGAGLTPIGKALDKSGTKLLDTGKKWSQWSPLGALVSTKNEKKRTLDDTNIDNGEIKVVSLRSHDFTGLGFNICGNMRDGIFIKDVLHRGPASESGKLNSGDRINSVRISFEHMVYEDALTILSYASPYEVEIEASGKHHHGLPGSGAQGAEPKHPIYRSSSSSDLVKIGKSARQRLFLQDDLDTVPTTESNNTTLERSRKSPRPDVVISSKPERIKKIQNKIPPEQLKLEQTLAQKISNTDSIERKNKIDAEKQTEADIKKGFQKFGIRVLPEKSPKSSELSQNDNNINQERQLESSVVEGRDEVDKSIEEVPFIKRREKNKSGDISKEQEFERQNSLNGSGIKRDKAGIPQEIPDHMLQAAVAARKNRKSSEEKIDAEDGEIIRTGKKQKGKAPAPPFEPSKLEAKPEENGSDLQEMKSEAKEYSDSDVETDNQSSVNTIELNSSDITIHHADQENNDMKGRKTASTGDLSKIQKTKKTNTGTLERAQSLDITDSGIPLSKKRKATKDDLESKLSSDESLYEGAVKEPRLSLALDGLDTFQRNRLKKSSEWGNLEDIMNLNDSSIDEKSGNLSDVQINLVENEEEPEEKVMNAIWPVEKHEQEILKIKPQIVDKKDKVTENFSETTNIKVQNILWPVADSEKIKSDIESSEKLTQKPPLPEPFSLKAQFQEKLNSKLNQPNDSHTKSENSFFHPGKSSQNFIFAEKYASNNDSDGYIPSKYDTNVSDDIKVSRHSLGSLERPKSDVLKNVNKLKMQSLISSDQGGISNITITETKTSQENGHRQNESTFDSTELYSTALDSLRDFETDGAKSITITETFTDTKYLSTDSPLSLTIDTSSDGPDSIKSNTLTFVTEIQVSPSSISANSDMDNKSEDSLRKLPEMKFTTSYEAPKTPEKRSHIELLRSNFEKSPPKLNKIIETSPSKSRIPVATKIDLKSGREIKIGEIDSEEIVEIMGSSIHSTPITNQKFANKSPVRNVTVTSIKTSSKIPSGLSNKPPVPARPDYSEIHDTRPPSSNGNSESTFKQWVFNPRESSVTNIVVNNNKEPHKQ